MDKIYDICCGIDVHKKLIVACLNHKRKKELREFGATTRELMELAKAGKVKPTPMKEEPMGDVQKWIDQLRAGKVVGRIMLTN